MIKKIISVKSIGRLRDCSASGDVELGKTSVIFAENAAGKTTLCDIFRSLRDGESSLLAGRRTAGSNDAPFVEIRLDTGTARFQSNSWNATLPAIEIFDARFVNENVYAGERVDHEHKKNLYRVIIGNQGVDLARRIEVLDSDIRSLNRDLGEAEQVLSRYKPVTIGLNDFLGLEAVDDVETKIAVAERDLAALRRSDELARRAAPVAIDVPTLPANLGALLAKTDASVAEDLEERVRRHLAAAHIAPNSHWLQQGVDLISEQSCPFCGQDLSDSEIVPLLKKYFSESYRSLKDEIDALGRASEAFASEVYLERLKGVVERNVTAVEFWLQFIQAAPPACDIESVQMKLQQAREIVREAAGRKKAQPLEAISSDGNIGLAIELCAQVAGEVTAYNEAVRLFCAAIDIKRGELGRSQINQAESDLTLLIARRDRHTQAVRDRCDTLMALRRQKNEADAEKRRVRTNLDDYTATVFPQYERDINILLRNFGASFEIHNTTGQQIGGTPSTTYALKINNVAIPLGDARTPLGEPSFSNTLSAGDRSALALAFFLVKVFRDPEVASKIVILDDPFNSQDSVRRQCTQSEICKLAERAAQVIVLSHDPTFLKGIFDGLRDQTVKTMQIAHFGATSRIAEWDVSDACREQYVKDHRTILEFIDRQVGETVNVRSRLRPILESYLTMKLPEQFDGRTNLGGMIAAIREAVSPDPKVAAQCILDELEAINEYATAPHHGNRGSGSGDSEPAELRAWAGRTLRLVRGFSPESSVVTI